MTAVEAIGFIALMAFLVISVIRDVAKQRQLELKRVQRKAKKEVQKHSALPTYKLAVKRKINKERPFFEEMKVEQTSFKAPKKKAFLPGGCSLRAAILSKEILDPPLSLR